MRVSVCHVCYGVHSSRDQPLNQPSSARMWLKPLRKKPIPPPPLHIHSQSWKIEARRPCPQNKHHYQSLHQCVDIEAHAQIRSAQVVGADRISTGGRGRVVMRLQLAPKLGGFFNELWFRGRSLVVFQMGWGEIKVKGLLER